MACPTWTCPSSSVPRPPATADGNIVASLARSSPLMRIPASGGSPTHATELTSGDVAHRWPQVLPGGKAVLFTSNKGLNSFDGATAAPSAATCRQRTAKGTWSTSTTAPCSRLDSIHPPWRCAGRRRQCWIAWRIRRNRARRNSIFPEPECWSTAAAARRAWSCSPCNGWTARGKPVPWWPNRDATWRPACLRTASVWRWRWQTGRIATSGFTTPGATR